jgi:hypothetical protein
MGLFTESGVSARTGEPFIKLTWEGPDMSGQLDVAQARELGLTILGAAEAAITDAALIRWLTTTLEMDLPRAAQVMADYRVARRTFDPENTDD